MEKKTKLPQSEQFQNLIKQ